ncbi:hypothetical protein LCGC14_1886450 [marine sediment metagenome]|uniref:Uncharacterized protein n=1 Tax=marine sediment metagenome TaxID=412755 RepID=A0A0F9G0Y0_9ZZZZ
MKAPKIKAGTVVLRWDGGSNNKGVVFKVTKKYATILWSGIQEKIKKETLKWQKKYSYDKNEWEWNWKAPALDIEETLDEKIEGAWIKTYRAGELVSMKLTEKAYRQMGQKQK